MEAEQIGACIVLVLLLVVLICMPCLIHVFMRRVKLRRLQQATKQAVNDSQMTSVRYCRDVAEFQARHSNALLANAVTSQMLAEMSDIRQRLTRRLHFIKLQLQREKIRNTVRRFSCIAICCSITSMFYYCALWMWVVYVLMMPEFDVTSCLVPACVWLAYVVVCAMLQYRPSCSSRSKLSKNTLYTLANQQSVIEKQPTTADNDYIELLDHEDNNLLLDNESIEFQSLLNDDKQFSVKKNIHGDDPHNNNYSAKQSATWELGPVSLCEWCVNFFCLSWYCKLLLHVSNRVNKKHQTIYKSVLLVKVKRSTASTSSSSQSLCYQQQDKRDHQVVALLSDETKSSSKTVTISQDQDVSNTTDDIVQTEGVTNKLKSISTLTSHQGNIEVAALINDIRLLGADNISCDVDCV